MATAQDLPFRIRFAEIPPASVQYVQMRFVLEVDIKAPNGETITSIQIPDFELRETREGEKYAKAPQKPILQRQDDGSYRVKQKDNKPWYMDIVRFATEAVEGEDRRQLTSGSLKVKDIISKLAIAEFERLSAEGGRSAAATSQPRQGSKTVSGNPRGAAQSRTTTTRAAAPAAPVSTGGDFDLF